MSLSAILSRFISQYPLEAIPIEVNTRARRHLLDTLGVALAGSSQHSAKQVRQGLAYLLEGDTGVPVWGTATSLSPLNAVLANGIASHALDYDDTHTDSILHGSAVLSACALALAESLGKNSDEMLSAWIIGWDVAARVGLAARRGFHQRGFHTTAIAGVFGATACAARLLELDEQQTCYALGLAGSQASGVAEYLSNSSGAKAFHAGWAAHSGIIAATLAKGGLTGPETIFEGRFGLYHTHAYPEAVNYDSLTQGLGKQWEIMNVSLKPYPVCHFAHATIDCARMLRHDGLTPEQIQHIECVIDPVAAALICEPEHSKFEPKTPYAAKFSLPWLIAAGFYQDGINLATLEGELNHPDWIDFAQRVSYRYPHQNEINFPRYFPGLILVTLHDGRTLSKSLPIHYGNPQNPMAIKDVEKKFKDNACMILNLSQAENILALLAQPQPFSISTLTRLLQVS